MKPLVSVIIPCYNHEKYVSECIESVINQSYENIELIVINDGSSDGSLNEIQKLAEKCRARFKNFILISRDNKGLSYTLNEGLKHSRGVYLSPIASDDLMLKDKILVQVDYLESNKSCFGVFGGVLINNGGNIISTPVQSKVYKFEDIYLQNYSLSGPTAMLRLNSVIEIGGYDVNQIIEDWYMWLKLTESGAKLNVIENIVAVYRIHDTNTSKNFEKMLDGRLRVISLYKNRRDYKLALAKVYLIQAIEGIPISNKVSMKLFFRSISINFKVIFSRKFLKFTYMIGKKLVKGVS